MREEENRKEKSEHKQRVLSALDDFNKGHKEPQCKCVECQLELWRTNRENMQNTHIHAKIAENPAFENRKSNRTHFSRDIAGGG